VVKVLCYKSEGAGSISDGVIDIIVSIALWPRVDSASNRNEYQDYFVAVKSGRCVRLTSLPATWAIVTKSGNPNFLEPSGHLGPIMGLICLYNK